MGFCTDLGLEKWQNAGKAFMAAQSYSELMYKKKLKRKIQMAKIKGLFGFYLSRSEPIV